MNSALAVLALALLLLGAAPPLGAQTYPTGPITLVIPLAPTEADAEEFIREVERRYTDRRALEREIAHWWEVSWRC